MLRADMRAAAVGGIVDSSARGSYLTSLSHRPYQWLADPESSWRTAIGSAASGVHMQSETAAAAPVCSRSSKKGNKNRVTIK